MSKTFGLSPNRWAKALEDGSGTAMWIWEKLSIVPSNSVLSGLGILNLSLQALLSVLPA